MYKIYHLLLVACLSTAAPTLQGSNKLFKPVLQELEKIEEEASHSDAPKPKAQPRAEEKRRVDVKVDRPLPNPAPQLEQSAQRPLNRPADAARPSVGQPQRAPIASRAVRQELPAAQPAARQIAVQNRPRPAVQDINVRIQPPLPAARPMIVNPPPQRRPQRVVLATPRTLPTIPLPSTIQLDERCAPNALVMMHPYAITPRGNMIELVDGSVWQIDRKRDRRKVRTWSLWDHVAIESSQFFIWTTFNLVNYTRGESAEVSMTSGPTYEGSASHWVAQCDERGRYVVLEDGSTWSFLKPSFEDWRANDAVVLGLAKDSSGGYVYMLINTRTQKHSLAINMR